MQIPVRKPKIYCVQFHTINPPRRQDYWFSDQKKALSFLERTKFHPNVSDCVIAGFEDCQLTEYDGEIRSIEPLFIHGGIKRELYKPEKE